MPAKKTYRRKRKSKKVGFLKRTGPGLSQSFPMGKTMKWNTRYADTNFRLEPTVSQTPVTKVYSLNGLWDPDITGIGHSALGFQQLVGVMYDHYCVIGARARVTATNLSASPQNFVVQIKDTNTVSLDISEIIENGLNVQGVLGAINTGQAVKNFSVNCSIGKFFGKRVLQDNKFEGDLNTNPDDGVFLHVTTQPMVGGNLSPVSFNIVIEYVAILTEPRQLLSS